MPPTDLTVEIFLIVRDTFFDRDGRPKPFFLRDKRNTQDDPLDEFIAETLTKGLMDVDCSKAPGPLVSPDMVVYRRSLCDGAVPALLKDDVSRIVAIEVKKLERMQSGQVARSTGLDYNTTPPCGTVRVYDADDHPLDIRGFYLFVCQERSDSGELFLTAMVLCDGDILNADYSLYLQITGQRQKDLGLGTYGDGVDRRRPMLIFANPLGATPLDHAATLVSKSETLEADHRMGIIYEVGRTIPEGGQGLFYAFRRIEDIPVDWELQRLVDPFPKPAHRIGTTQARGRFRLPIRACKEGR